MKWSALTFLLASGCGALSSPKSPVRKVIQLLGDLKAQVEKDLRNEEVEMARYSEYCQDEDKNRVFSIKEAATEIERTTAEIEDAEGEIQEMAAVVDERAALQASKEKDLETNIAERAEIKKEYDDVTKELNLAIDQLNRAIVILKRETKKQSFIQNKFGGAKEEFEKRLGAISGALSAVIGAAWVPEKNKRALQTLLEAKMGSEDELSLNQPQAVVKAYEFHSGSDLVIEKLEELKDKAQETLRARLKDEMESKHGSELIQQNLRDGIENDKFTIRDAQMRGAEAEEKKGVAQSGKAAAESNKAADEGFLQQLRSGCQSKADEWDERRKAAREELQVLAEGLNILKDKFSFVQVRVTPEEDTRNHLLNFLRQLGRKFKSYGLMELANAAHEDPFVKVRGLIENMIASLQEQQAAEAEHDTFCKEETVKTAASKKEKARLVDKFNTRKDKTAAMITKLTQEIATLNGEVTEIDTSDVEATKIRNAEHEQYIHDKEEYESSARELLSAIQVLKDFYNKDGSFLQNRAGSEQPPAGPEFARGKAADAAKGIIGILETAQADFTKLLSDTEVAESEAQEAYDKLMVENKVSKSAKEATVVGKQTQLKTMEVRLGTVSDDLLTATQEMEAVIKYSQGLAKSCENKAMTYEERQEKRTQEIEGLKEALNILQGDAAGESLLQKRLSGGR